jgi:hypothetical protein
MSRGGALSIGHYRAFNMETNMSPLTIFLAKLLGLYCVILALTMIVRGQSAVAAMKALVANPSLLLFAEVIGLALGLAMVLSHNIWSGGALPVVVTLIGWLIVIRSAVLLALSPEATVKLVDALQYEKHFYIYMGATLALGLYLTYAGFSA